RGPLADGGLCRRLAGTSLGEDVVYDGRRVAAGVDPLPDDFADVALELTFEHRERSIRRAALATAHTLAQRLRVRFQPHASEGDFRLSGRLFDQCAMLEPVKDRTDYDAAAGRKQRPGALGQRAVNLLRDLRRIGLLAQPGLGR